MSDTVFWRQTVESAAFRTRVAAEPARVPTGKRECNSLDRNRARSYPTKRRAFAAGDSENRFRGFSDRSGFGLGRSIEIEVKDGQSQAFHGVI
jgi:hypothetical protein